MDVDSSSSSSPAGRLSVLCSASNEYSSNSSEASSPTSRRSSMNEHILKDDQYWERRRKNNDASKRSREKRRLGDIAMEQRILALSRENEILKTQLESRTATDSLLATRNIAEFAALPAQSNTVQADRPSIFAPTSLNSALGLPSLPLPSTLPLASSLAASANTLPPVLPTTAAATSALPLLQIYQLQSALQQQAYRPQSASSVFSLGSAFTPFQKESVVMKAERISPDSSSDRTQNVIRRVPTPPPTSSSSSTSTSSSSSSSHSILGQILSSRRVSPSVPQSRTEHRSGLSSPPRTSCSKSDCESISSSASLSPSHSSEDHSENSAIREALGGENRLKSYMDRRRRNNEAAKRCRANRRAVFEYRSKRVQLLEGENEQLKEEISRLKQELQHQKALLSSLNKLD
ncbi:unnamed protein product [Auanema sp. JU1783]|nr:unnamed protein product [Auanema sp. JU1783]